MNLESHIWHWPPYGGNDQDIIWRAILHHGVNHTILHLIGCLLHMSKIRDNADFTLRARMWTQHAVHARTAYYEALRHEVRRHSAERSSRLYLCILSISLSLYIYIYIYIIHYLSIYLSINLSLSLYIYIYIYAYYLSAERPSIYVSIIERTPSKASRLSGRSIIISY